MPGNVKIGLYGSPPRLWGTPGSVRVSFRSGRITPTPVGNAPGHQYESAVVADHPHACGERAPQSRSCVPSSGSPPRLWGTHMLRTCELSLIRITPTPVGNARACPCSSPIKPDHPHACGERAQNAAPLDPSPGSPPRLWGTPGAAERRIPQFRITPTPVGNAQLQSSQCPCLSDHPHACGERGHVAQVDAALAGSPPRLWGTHAAQHPPAPADRITPTPVGNAPTSSIRQASTSDHPHACGERAADQSPWKGGADHPHACGERNQQVIQSLPALGSPPRLWGTPTVNMPAGSVSGSPPRLWGTLKSLRGAVHIARITPTPVGNACRPSWRACSGTDHPHACGERTSYGPVMMTADGSPPRLWGTRRAVAVAHGVPRITPTPVGNAPQVDVCPVAGTDHPHACGERKSKTSTKGLGLGSPPRLWGTRSGEGQALAVDRITPTPVGNALNGCPKNLGQTDHPHACGERAGALDLTVVELGSPPRLWGTRHFLLLRGFPVRITPTPVGNA